jgi:hypothetical protein
MKKLLLLSAFCLPLLLSAQPNFDFYALHSSDQTTRAFNAWGGGMNMLYNAMEFKALKSLPLTLQIGGGYYIAAAGSKRIELNSGVTEVLTFNNSHMGLYGMTRFSPAPGSARRTVYIDFLAGMRYSNATLCHVKGDEDNDTTLNSFNGFMGGAGAGILFRINDHVFMDVGVQWQAAAPGGKFVAMNTVRNTGDGVSYQMQKVPANLLVFKIGFHFNARNMRCCEKDGCKIRSHHVKSCAMNHHP